MKFTIDTKKFSSTITAMVDIFKKNSMLSAMGNELLITAGKDVVDVESANMGMYIKATVTAKVKEEGKFLINSNYLSKLKLYGKSLTFTHKEDSRIIFKCGRFNGQLDPAQNLARIEEKRPLESNIKSNITLPPEPLKKGLKLVDFTQNKDVTSVLPLKIICKGKNLILSTYDSTSATYYHTKVENLTNVDAILPALFIQSAIEKLGDISEIGISKKLIKIKSQNFIMYHPPRQDFQIFDVVTYYNNLVKCNPALSFTCKASLWLEALQTTASLTLGLGITDNNLLVSVDPEKKVALINLSSNIGTAQSEFELDEISNATIKEFRISSFIYTDFLENIQEEKILVRLYQDDYRRVLIETLKEVQGEQKDEGETGNTTGATKEQILTEMGDISYLLPLAQ